MILFGLDLRQKQRNISTRKTTLPRRLLSLLNSSTCVFVDLVFLQEVLKEFEIQELTALMRLVPFNILFLVLLLREFLVPKNQDFLCFWLRFYLRIEKKKNQRT